MIISEKQVMTLMLIVRDFITIIGPLKHSSPAYFNVSGQINLDKCLELINQIYDQQSEEPKVIE